VWSFDFAEIESLQQRGDWDAAAERLSTAGRNLASAGAEALLICTNTMHRVAEAIDAATDVPLLHLADATAARIRAAGLDTIGLLGTRYTMEMDFYRGRLARHGLRVLTPDADARREMNRVIFDELVLGRVEEASRRRVAAMVEALAARGAEGVIEGCTEITLLELGDLVELPRFDTTAIHAEAAVDWALADDPEDARPA
jgi:aspartate racemase